MDERKFCEIKLCSSSIPFRFCFISKMVETKECKEFEENNELFSKIDKWKFLLINNNNWKGKNVCKKIFKKEYYN